MADIVSGVIMLLHGRSIPADLLVYICLVVRKFGGDTTAL